MADIFQQIWDADQLESGVVSMLDTVVGDPLVGFVKVNSNLDSNDPDLRVLTDVTIPANKLRSYNLCKVLFDNYALRERDDENETPKEREEVHDLVLNMVDTAPMLVAREYVEQATGTSISRERWYNTIMELWFRRFSMGGDPALSGFEHVVVGEQEGSKAQGYHFWYKYFLDDGFAKDVDGSAGGFPGLKDDRITYRGSKLGAGQDQFPESVTISYRWDAPDYDRKALRPLTKKIGGFFVGCSVEGLLALGTVRAHVGARAPKQATINGARYDLKVFRSPNNRHVRTFYPMFKGAAGPGPNPDDPINPVTSGGLRIVAALINPQGDDPGSETVTLINIGDVAVDTTGWHIVDRNSRSQSLSGLSIAAGDALRLVLDPSGPQLSNRGGRIVLVDASGQTVHAVTYSKGQARDDGKTVLF